MDEYKKQQKKALAYTLIFFIPMIILGIVSTMVEYRGIEMNQICFVSIILLIILVGSIVMGIKILDDTGNQY